MIATLEADLVERANASGRTPVVFIHGLWLIASSWERWMEVFDAAGFVSVAPGWPDDPSTVAEARAHPMVFAGKGVGQVADHLEAFVRLLKVKPALVGHSYPADPDEQQQEVLEFVENLEQNVRREGSAPFSNAGNGQKKTVDLRAHGISREQAADLRARLSTFAEDWNDPAMDVYDVD